MATTPNYGFIMPDPTDFVTNLPADFEIFGDEVDARIKALNPGTTAGDIDYYTSSTAKARLAKGTAGQVLAMNSGATAPEWINAPSGAAPFLQPKISGAYYRMTTNIALTDISTIEDVTHYTPVYLPSGTYDRIGFAVPSRTVTGNTRLGIYANSTNNLPSTLLLDAGTVSVTAATTFEITINITLDAGWYWLAINKQSGTYTFSRPGNSDVSVWNGYAATLNEVLSTGSSTLVKGFTQTGVTGAFANAGTLVPETTPALAAVRIA